MSDPKNEPNQSTVLPEAETAKQPYEKPDVIYRAPLEATAGACGTSPGKASGGPPDNCTVLGS
jgi:hypothetical protein